VGKTNLRVDFALDATSELLTGAYVRQHEDGSGAVSAAEVGVVRGVRAGFDGLPDPDDTDGPDFSPEPDGPGEPY
jgi:hypothetical protein